jgi:hypothetical protein
VSRVSILSPERTSRAGIEVDELVLPAADRRLAPCPARHEPPGVPGVVPVGSEQRIRFRWLLGHQVTLCVWRAQGWLLHAIVSGCRPPGAWTTAAVRLFDVYSLMLLYAGSCSPEEYDRVLRADMRSWHPAFSGEWFRDYPVIPELVRRITAERSATVSGPLAVASRRNRRTHMAIARKLVPGGVSLLRETGRRPAAGGTPEEAALIDAYFRVRRAPSCHGAFAAQAVARTELAVADISARGLHGAAVPPAPLVPEHGAELARLERDAVPLLGWLAEWLSHPVPGAERVMV